MLDARYIFKAAKSCLNVRKHLAQYIRQYQKNTIVLKDGDGGSNRDRHRDGQIDRQGEPVDSRYSGVQKQCFKREHVCDVL